MALMSSAIAFEEGTPPIPETPPSRSALLGEIRQIHDELDVSRRFAAWRTAVGHVAAIRAKKDRYFIIEVDLAAMSVVVTSFRPGESVTANAAYIAAEKKIGARTDAQVVFAGSRSFENVEMAFPSYFNDTELFLEILQRNLK